MEVRWFDHRDQTLFGFLFFLRERKGLCVCFFLGVNSVCGNGESGEWVYIGEEEGEG